MSKSHKTHKKRLQKFKQSLKSVKMSQQNYPQPPYASQYPQWNANETIEVSGQEWQSIYNFINIFSEGVLAAQTVLQRNFRNGKIKWVFKDAEGKDVPEETMQKYQVELQKFFAAQKENKPDNTKPITAEEQKDLPKVDAIVDSNGTEAK